MTKLLFLMPVTCCMPSSQMLCHAIVLWNCSVWYTRDLTITECYKTLGNICGSIIISNDIISNRNIGTAVGFQLLAGWFQQLVSAVGPSCWQMQPSRMAEGWQLPRGGSEASWDTSKTGSSLLLWRLNQPEGERNANCFSFPKTVAMTTDLLPVDRLLLILWPFLLIQRNHLSVFGCVVCS